MEEDAKTQQLLQSIMRRKNNSAIAIAFDKASSDDASICRIAIAWISESKAHSMSCLVKPPTDDFSCSRKVTASMVAHSADFATVWDRQILPLLKGDVLALYDASRTLHALKASYETSGRAFMLPELYIRDLRFLAITYMPGLGNDSFISIIHRLRLSADLDDAASRARACTSALDRLQMIYPASGYGVPLSMVLAGALNLPADTLQEDTELENEEEEEEPAPLLERLTNATRFSLIPLLVICLCLFGYYMYRQRQNEPAHVDFSSYSSTEVPKSQKKELPRFEAGKTYTMMRGTYVVMNEKDIDLFVTAAKEHDTDKIRTMLRNGQVLVFQSAVPIEVTGDPHGNGFVPITIKEGDHAGQSGYAAYSMITKSK